jgi:hypothetical protein
MSKNSRWIYAVTFLLAAAGFLMPLWPLSVLVTMLAALSGRWIFAVMMGLMLDLAWGAPTGTLQYLFFPFTIVALLCVVARSWGGYYFLDRNPQEKI